MYFLWIGLRGDTQTLNVRRDSTFEKYFDKIKVGAGR